MSSLPFPRAYLGVWASALVGLFVLASPIVLLSLAGGELAEAASEAPVDLTQPPPLVDPGDVRTDATVRVIARNCHGRNAGTGFVTEYGIVTAAHVVEGSVAVAVAPDGYDDGNVRLAEPVVLERRQADQIDAAVLTGPKGHPEYVLRDGLPEVGEPLAIVGFPFGGEQVIRTGVVIDVGTGEQFGVPAERVLIVSAPVDVGMSGGPVLDADGRAVGLVLGLEENSNTAVVIPIADLGELLAGGGNPVAKPDC